MIRKLNPVLIGGFTVLYIGPNGFSSLADATKALIRPRGVPKKTPWVELSFVRGKKKTKTEKERLLIKALHKLSKGKGGEAEDALRLAKTKVGKTPKKSQTIKFELRDVSDKLVKTLGGQYLETTKYFFHTPRSIEFVEGRDIKVNAINTYIQAVKREFISQVFNRYGDGNYLIRLYHDYENLESNQTNDPLERGFSGLGLNRQYMTLEDVEEQFQIMGEMYVESFGKYLQFARSDTYFRFTGFTAEVVTSEQNRVEGKGAIKVEKKLKKKKIKAEVKTAKKPKKKKVAKTKKKKVQKKTAKKKGKRKK